MGNSRTDEEEMDVLSPAELLLPNSKDNKNFAASFNVSNVFETANADVSRNNEIIGSLFVCSDFNNENKLISDFTLLCTHIVYKIDLKRYNVQLWKYVIITKHFQKNPVKQSSTSKTIFSALAKN